MPLGSIREVPAESCEEIKASEGKEALCKNWLKSSSSVETTLVHCYLDAKGWFAYSFVLTCLNIITTYERLVPSLHLFDFRLRGDWT